MTMALQAEGLGRSYPLPDGATLTALDDVSLAVAEGRSLAVMGGSGSGKSTLLGLLAGLDAPDRGRVRVRGQDLAELGADALSSFRGRHIGFVFQSWRLLPELTALENVAVPLELAGVGADAAVTRARDLLASVGLADRAGHLPSRLSGGEQQRVAIARALANGPALILADEPTGNLDSANGGRIADLLFGLVRDHAAALVVATHDAALAGRADQVLRLRDGRVSDG